MASLLSQPKQLAGVSVGAEDSGVDHFFLPCSFSERGAEKEA